MKKLKLTTLRWVPQAKELYHPVVWNEKGDYVWYAYRNHLLSCLGNRYRAFCWGKL